MAPGFQWYRSLRASPLIAAVAGGMLPAPGTDGVSVCPGGVMPETFGGVIPIADGSLPTSPAFSPPDGVPAISVPVVVPEVAPELFRNDETANMMTPTSATPPPASKPIISPLPLFFGGVRR
jgi:hypothetical protein